MDFNLEDKQEIEIEKLNYYYQICNDALSDFTANHHYQLAAFEKENITMASDIDDEKFINIPFDMFQNLFYPAYAITIYKSQGSTFDHPYTIHEWNHPLFDNILKYVALSRSSALENINVFI